MPRLVIADRVVLGSGAAGDAILMDGSRVQRVGRAEELRRPGAIEHDYRGRVIIPGLRDAHFHPVVYAATLSRLTLKDVTDLADLGSRLSEASRHLAPDEALIGSRLDDESLAEGRLPTRHDLDPFTSDRPVLLHRYCGHIAVANTRALEAAGIGPETSDPPGGSFDRDDQGRPTGVLRETAVAEVGRAMRSGTLRPDQLLSALAGLPKLGLTSIGAMVSLDLDPWCGVPAELDALLALNADLPLDVGVFGITSHPEAIPAAAERLLSEAGSRLRFLGWKYFADGSFGGHTAALREPYHDVPGQRGILRLDRARARALARATTEAGGMVALHAIGDLACSLVLDVFEDLIDDGVDPADLRIEHASLLTDQDLYRLAHLGATASVQPAFVTSETSWLPKRLGAMRMEQVYRFSTMLAAGIPLAGGSDAPVENPNPFAGIASARTGIVRAQALDARQALHLFTDGAARALHEPAPLAAGSPATFIVIDRDPLEASPEEVSHTHVEALWKDGRQIALAGREPYWPG